MPPFEIPFRGETKRLNTETRDALPGDFVQLPQGVVHYELSGPKDETPVVLVHGFSVPCFIWDPTFEALKKEGFRVLRYDLFGRGYSDRPLLPYTVELFVSQLAELLTALEINKPIDLAGLSMGGVVTANFMVAHPERVRKLCLIDPAGFDLKIPLAYRLLLVPGVGELLFSLVGDGSLLKGIAEDFFEPKHVEMFIEEYRPQMKYKGFKRAILSTIRQEVLGDALDVYRQIGKLDCPTQLIWGKEDRTVPFENSQKLLEAIPGIEFHAIDQAGHIPHYERPGTVNPLLISFLRGE